MMLLVLPTLVLELELKRAGAEMAAAVAAGLQNLRLQFRVVAAVQTHLHRGAVSAGSVKLEACSPLLLLPAAVVPCRCSARPTAC